MNLETFLWQYGAIALVIVFVVSFAVYTYRYWKDSAKGKIIILRSTEERVKDLEKNVEMIMSGLIKEPNEIKCVKIEYESGSTEIYTKVEGDSNAKTTKTSLKNWRRCENDKHSN